jgi:hypothetical protein
MIFTGVFDIVLGHEGVWGDGKAVYIEHSLTFCLMEGNGSDSVGSRCAI